MTVGTILALVILVSFLVTLILAIGSYIAYKLREGRRPRPLFTSDSEFQFFDRYIHTREAQVSRERQVAEREASGAFDTTNPGRTNPGRTNPGRTNPGRTNPGRTNPGRTDPGRTNPERTDPGLTNPERTDPGLTNPERTDPGL